MEANMDEITKIINEVTEAIEKFEEMIENGEVINKIDLAGAYLRRSSMFIHSDLLKEGHVDASKSINILEQMAIEGKQVDVYMLSEAYLIRSITNAQMGNPDLAKPDIDRSIELMMLIKNSGAHIDEEEIKKPWIFMVKKLS